MGGEPEEVSADQDGNAGSVCSAEVTSAAEAVGGIVESQLVSIKGDGTELRPGDVPGLVLRHFVANRNGKVADKIQGVQERSARVSGIGGGFGAGNAQQGGRAH